MQAYLAEFIGSFIFFTVILQATAKNANWPNLAPLMIVFGLLAGIVVAASGSGAHLNPAVSVMMLLNKSLPMNDFLPYVGAQVAGAVAAKMCVDMLNRA